MTKHTPRPWKVEGHGISGMVQGRLDTVAEVRAYGLTKPWQANASLIASAPELLEALEACERLLSANPPSGMGSGTLPYIRAAIAKAKGE